VLFNLPYEKPQMVKKRRRSNCCANGVASANPTVVQVLQKMHPSLTEELKLPSSSVSQLQVEASSILIAYSVMLLMLIRVKMFLDGWLLYYSVRGIKEGFLHNLSLCLVLFSQTNLNCFLLFAPRCSLPVC